MTSLGPLCPLRSSQFEGLKKKIFRMECSFKERADHETRSRDRYACSLNASHSLLIRERFINCKSD